MVLSSTAKHNKPSRTIGARKDQEQIEFASHFQVICLHDRKHVEFDANFDISKDDF